MSVSRSAPASRPARMGSGKKPPAPVAKKAARKPTAGRSASTAESRKAAEMLRDIQLEGEALSAQIERLRHRFL